MNETQELRIEERLQRAENLVERLDQVASKLANAAETMAEAVNRGADIADSIDTSAQNLEGTLSRDRQRRRTGG